MSKERIEEIKERLEYIQGNLMIDEFNWLIEQAERVQELEDIIYQDARQAVLEGLYEENERYREAIKEAVREFNQDEHHHGMTALLKVLEESKWKKYI